MISKARSYLNKPIVLLVAVAFIAGAIGYMGVRSITDKKSIGVQAAACEADVCIGLKADGADPAETAIPIGQSIQFNSADGKSHSLSLGEGGSEHEHTGKFSSGEFKSDEAWKVQFKEAGTYEFHDHLNPKISILIVAYKPGAEHKITR